METDVTVELDDDDLWLAVEDNVQEQITSFIDEHLSEYDHASQEDSGVENQVYELLLQYKNGVKSCGTGKAFEEAVWKAICRLDNPDTHDSVWAAAAKEYLLSVTPKDTSAHVRGIVREELATVLLSFAKAVDARLGAEIAVAPGD